MKKIILFLLALSISLTTIGCRNRQEKNEFKAYFFDWFDTATVITGYEKSQADFDKVVAELEAAFSKYYKLYDIYKRYEGLNNLTVINEKSEGHSHPIKVESEITELISFSRSMYDLTEGKFNIAMGSVLSIWHSYREKGMADPQTAQLPPMDTLREAALHCDINNIIVDSLNQTVHLADDKLTLDVGAIAKGYACEQVARQMEKKGITGYCINVGGNVRAVGSKPDGKEWLVGVENPNKKDSKNPYVAYLRLENQALVTSGSYQRFYTVEGKNYHHIIDPATLMPSERYLSVSVLSDSSASADALSTALFNMPLEEGKALINGLDSTEAMWVLPSGEITYSKSFENYLTEYKE